MDVLIVPDAHARKGVSNRRFTWLGRLIVDVKPDVVICLGDLFDMESLSSYDGSALTGNTRPKLSFEGRSYLDDIAAGADALDRVQTVLARAAKSRPRRVFVLGNHENRIERAVSNVRELSGTLSTRDLQLERYGWEPHAFLEPVDIAGFVVQHYFVSGLLGRPIGGETHARSLLMRTHESAIQGHTHLWDFHQHTTPRGQRKQAFVCGWYGDPEQKEAFAGASQHMWCGGVTLLKDVEKGCATGGFRFISTKEMQREYGNRN